MAPRWMGMSIQKSRILEILNAECYDVTVIFIARWLHYFITSFNSQNLVVVETIVIAPRVLRSPNGPEKDP